MWCDSRWRPAAPCPSDRVDAGGRCYDLPDTVSAAAGARVIASARSDDFDECATLGASAVVDYRDGAAAIGLAASDGIDVYIDTSGNHDFEAALRVLARGGRIVLIAHI